MVLPIRLPAKAMVDYVAAEGQTVYVTASTVGGPLPRTVTSYPVPAACR
jgi:hypothetical protein